MKHEEENNQATLILWASYYPELRWLHAIPNGGNRNLREAARLKKQGVKPGVSDLFLPVPRYGYHGMYIEMKAGKNKPTGNQKEFIEAMRNNRYKVVICYGFESAKDEISGYMDVEKTQ